MADRKQEPDRRPELAAFTRRGRRGGHVFRQLLGRRAPLAPQPHEGRGDAFGTETVEQRRGQPGLVARRLGQGRMVQHPRVVASLHLVGRGGLAPFRDQLGALEQALRPLVFRRRHDQHRGALGPGPAGAAGTVQQRVGIGRQVGMDHQLQPRQVDAARRHVGGDADPRPAVAQRLQGVAAFLLGQLTRQRHHLEAAIAHARQQVVHVGAGLAEDDRPAGLVEAQGVEDGMLPVAGRHRQGAIVDVAVLARLAHGLDAQGVALEVAGQRLDGRRHGGREHQRAPFLGRAAQDELQILAETQVQHLVRLVQHAGAQGGQVQRAALDMVAQAAGGADDDMGAALQRPALGAIVHAADAGGDARARLFVKPAQLARHLQGQLARGRDGQRQRLLCVGQGVARKDVAGHGQAEGHGLARAGLGRDQHVATPRLGRARRYLPRGLAGRAVGRPRRGHGRGNIMFVHLLRQKGDAGTHPVKGTIPFAAGPSHGPPARNAEPSRPPILSRPASQSETRAASADPRSSRAAPCPRPARPHRRRR